MSNLGKYTERIASTLLKNGHFYRMVYKATGENGLVQITRAHREVGYSFAKAYDIKIVESRRYGKAAFNNLPVTHHFFENNDFFLNPNDHIPETKKQVIHRDILLDELERIELLGNIDRAIDSGDQELFMRLTSQLKTHFVNN